MMWRSETLEAHSLPWYHIAWIHTEQRGCAARLANAIRKVVTMITSSRSFVSPTLIGRADALAALRATLAEACGGNGQIVLLAGEAGMGKSRLVREAIASADDHAMGVASGYCCESERAFPYAPLSEMLSHLRLQTLDSAFGPLWAAHAAALQDVLTPNDDMPGLDAASARYRLFRSLNDLLIALAHRQPLLLILEDAHWSDDGTLEFLSSFARHFGSLPLCLILTYRNDELSPALQHLLALFDRTRLTVEIHLSPLDISDIERMIRVIFDLRRPVQREFVAALTRLTGGNPFFVEELLKSLMAGGDLLFADVARNSTLLADLQVPRTVDETMQRRLPFLSPAARQLLTVLAVAGSPTGMDLLQAVLAVDETELLALIAEGTTAQFLSKSSGDMLSFRHDLTRQAVYNASPEHERRQWHRSIAACIEKRFAAIPDALAIDLARHWYLAQQWEKALDTNRHAGLLAQAWYAPQAAIMHFGYAIEAAARLNRAPQLDLMRARAQAAMTIGALESARSDFEAVLALRSSQTDSGHDIAEQWQALLDLGSSWDGIDYTRTRQYYERAFDLAQSSGRPLLVARSGNRIGNWYMNMEQPEEALRYHRQALAIFIDANESDGVIDCHILIAYAGVFTGDLTLALNHFRQSIALARQSGDRQSLSAALGAIALCSPICSTDTMLATLSLAEAERQVEGAWQLAQAIGWRMNEAITSVWRAALATTRGDFGAARRYSEEGLAIAEEMKHPEWEAAALYGLGNLSHHLCSLEAAQTFLERALVQAEEMRSLHFRRVMTGRLACVLARSDQCERARLLLDMVMSPEEAMLTPGQRECWYGYATLALAEGNPTAALDIVERLVASSQATSVSGIPRLAVLSSEALLALGRAEEAIALARDAYRIACAQTWNTLAWRLGALWGRALHVQGDDDMAAQIWAEARILAETLATSIPSEPERATFLQGMSVEMPTFILSSSPPRVARGAGDLTPREREVALLVACGYTNRRIARELVISEETATVHVKHILHKLQFASRSQIAAWVVDQRLDIPHNG